MTDGRHAIQRFEVVGHLGSGGMGTVYRARDPQLERDVAIKVLAAAERPSGLDDHATIDLRANQPAAPGDLLAEARIMARLSHPNVLPVYEVGIDRGSVFLVMEHIAGCDLRSWLVEPRPLAAIVDVLAQAGRGLAAAHAQSIVHRDFKPENVLVGDDGRVRVADFGLSRLVRATALRRSDDGGTPEYMAPELWRGESATPASDAYAYCTTCIEAIAGARGDATALRDRGVSPRLVALIAAGLDDDPRKRPDVADIVAAMTARGWSRRRTLAIGAALAIGTAAAVAYAATTGGDAVGCTVDGSRLAGRWDAARRAELVGTLGRRYAGAPIVNDIAARFDEHAAAIDAVAHETCEARSRGELTDAQVAARSACLDRRAAELGAVVGRVVANDRLKSASVADRAMGISTAAGCVALAVPPPADPDAVAALYGRYAEGIERPDRVAVYAELERDARAAGDPELALRAAMTNGSELMRGGKLAKADAVFEQSYRDAVALHADALAATSLVERAFIANETGNPKNGRELGKLAVGMADNPAVTMRTAVRAYVVLERAYHALGDNAQRLAIAKQGLERSRKANGLLVWVDLGLRRDLRYATTSGPGHEAEAVELARQEVELTSRVIGTHESDYALALADLASALHVARRIDDAIATRRQALAVALETLPAHAPQLVLMRADFAADMIAVGRCEEARRESAAALAEVDHAEGLHAHKPRLQAQLGVATFCAGQFDEAITLLDQALEESISQNGSDHDSTISLRRLAAAFALDRDRLDDAKRHIAALRRTYQQDPKRKLDEIRLRGTLAVEEAIARHRPAAAEQMARRALGELAALPEDKGIRAEVLHALGESLDELHRYADARPLLAEALAIEEALQAPEISLASYRIELARADVGGGDRAAGLAAAAAVRDLAAKHPMLHKQGEIADELLKKMHR